MKKFFVTALSLLVALLPLATPSAFAAGISASGGGSKVVGQNFTISVVASGAEFDSLQGTISVSGPISIVSFGAGSATWLPGKSPSNGNQFVGITSPTRSLTVASITLKGTKEGKGSVTVSGVRLARNGSYVGDSGGSASFTIGRAPTPPGTIEISSSTHPDQGTAYAATTLEIAWKAPSNGASGYSYGINEVADTAPEQKVTGTGTSAKYEGLTVGTHYFHIRAQNGDGWGPAAHFKVVIKEPDAKIDSALGLPSIMSVEKTAQFATDIETGTVRGFVVKGAGGISGYTVNLAFSPKDRLPAELFQAIAAKSDTVEAGAIPTPTSTATTTPLMATPAADGAWSVTIDQPIPAGFYRLTVQSQKDKVLSPESTAVSLELSVAAGGSIRLITAADKTAPIDNHVNVLGIKFPSSSAAWLTIAVIILLIAISQLVTALLTNKLRLPFGKKKEITKSGSGPTAKQL
jgi:hypothetical protein